MAAESFAGFTVEEYTAYVQEFMKQPVPGFVGMTYGERIFVPMAELVKYLDTHDFQVFICSGTERIFLREMIADTLGNWIPPYRVIGSTFSLTATGQLEDIMHYFQKLVKGTTSLVASSVGSALFLNITTAD